MKEDGAMTTFHCHGCGSITDLSDMLQAFEHNPHCPTCGLSVAESDAKMQDELADLMTRNMHLGMRPPAQAASTPPTPEVVPQLTPITYISQHYHHSAHVAPIPVTEETSTVLKNSGVDADALLPSQLMLFKNAESEQQRRLIELWRIAPPTYGGQLASSDMGNWPQTSMETEEEAARQRWEKQEQERLKNLSVLPSQGVAEPYMKNGYDADVDMDGEKHEYRQATDPAYDREREWWRMSGEQPMEHQYGMLQQMQMLHGFCGVVDRDRMW